MKTIKHLFCLLLLMGSMVAKGADVVYIFSEQGFVNAQKISSGVIDASNNTIWTASKGSGTIDPAYYDLGNALRIYGGGNFTISSDYIIKEVVLTLDITDKSDEFEQSSVQLPNDYSITFTRANGGGHVRVQKIEITYEKTSSYTVSELMQVYYSLNLASGMMSSEQYTVRGYVTKWNSGYPNYQNADFYIDDTPYGSTTKLECFRLTGQSATDMHTLQVGDLIEATAYLQNYNGRAELCNGSYKVLEGSSIEPEPEDCAFEDLEGMTSTQLLTALKAQISNHSVLSYDNVRADKSRIDIKPDGTVWDMYSSCTFYASEYCRTGNYNECDCYNREHALPKSWWGGDTSEPMYTDLHHILPTDYEANTNRSADAYGVVTNADWTNSLGSKKGDTNTYTGGNYRKVFEPADQYKGDIARIYFYMLTCYRDKNFTVGGQGYRMFTYSASVANFTNAACQLLLQWHRADPVSDKEKDRNDKIEILQGNRNPFVDDPNLAEFIWGKYKDKGYTCDINSLVAGEEDIATHHDSGATKIIENGVLYIILPDGRKYDILGVEVK